MFSVHSENSRYLTPFLILDHASPKPPQTSRTSNDTITIPMNPLTPIALSPLVQPKFRVRKAKRKGRVGSSYPSHTSSMSLGTLGEFSLWSGATLVFRVSAKAVHNDREIFDRIPLP